MIAEWGQAVVVFIVAVLVLKLILSYVDRPSNLPPGPWGLPIVGYLPFLGNNHHTSLVEISRKYGPINSLYMGQNLVVHLASYETIREAFVKQADNFSLRPDYFPFRVYDTDNGIITTNGHIFRVFKSFILTTLKDTGAAKNKLELIVKDNSEAFVKYLRSLNAQPTDVLEALGVSVATTYTVMLLGKKFSKEDPWIKRMVGLLYREQRSYGNGMRVYMPWTRDIPGLHEWIGEKEIREVKKGIHELLESEVKIAEKDYVEGSRSNFVHAWFTEAKLRKEKMPDDDLFKRLNLRHNMDYVFSAGYDTTVTTLRWFFIYMMLYPDIQEKLRQEIDDVIGRDRTPFLDDEPNMPYTQATMQEIHRFATIVPIGVHHSNREETTLCGYHIPANSYVISNILAVHDDPVRFPEPKKFKPERFIDSNGKFIKDEHVIPFSLGKRACPGEPLAQVEIFMYMTYLLQNFIIKEPEDEVITLNRIPSISSNPHHFMGRFIPRP